MPDSEETRKAAGPYREEVDQNNAKEALGDGAADRPLRQGSLGEKEDKDVLEANPKRTENSRPD